MEDRREHDRTLKRRLPRIDANMSTTLSSPPPRTSPPHHGPYIPQLSQDAYDALGCMEGVYDLPLVEPRPAAPAAPVRPLWQGYALSILVCVAAYGAHYLPFAPFRVAIEGDVRRPISAAILAIVLGLIVRNTLHIPAHLLSGCKVVVRRTVPLSIVLLGAELQFARMSDLGHAAVRIVAIIVTCIVFCMVASWLIGRAMGLSHSASLLIGAGTAICGNSAIVAVAPLVDADDDDLGWSVGTVNALGLVAMLVLPPLGAMLHLSGQAFGIWAGTSIHAVPQVVAAGFTYSNEAGAMATLVKLVRVAMLAPLVFGLALAAARRSRQAHREGQTLTVHYARLVPWFVWGFVALSILNSVGLIPTLNFPPSTLLNPGPEEFRLSMVKVLTQTGTALLTLSMGAIGLELGLAGMMKVGKSIFICGALATVVLMIASYGLIRLLM